MKHLRKLLVMLCFIFIISGAYSTTVDAARYMILDATVKGYNTVKLSWEKKSVKGYKIYRAYEVKKGVPKFKLIATVNSKTTSYTDKTVKKNKSYVYRVVGYTYKNKKYKEKYDSLCECYTHLSHMFVDDYFDKPKTSPERISFGIGPDLFISMEYHAVIPDGIEILKKKNGKYVSYKKISYKKYKKGYTFVDKQVKPGKKHFYKFRCYKKINGKIVYSSSKGTQVSLYARNCHPSSTVKEVSGDSQEMIFSLTNNEKYGNIKIDSSCNLYFKDEEKFNYDSGELDIIAYSFNGSVWSTDVKNCQVKPGETIYLKMKETSDLTYSYNDISELEIGGRFDENYIVIEYNFIDKTTDSYCDD